jgi:hypothetical protein
MRRGWKEFGALVVTALVLAMTSSVATAAGPPIVNLSPANGTTYTTGPASYVEFTCPRFTTSYSSEVTASSYYVTFATSPELNPNGELASPFVVGFTGAYPINAAEDLCRAEISGTIMSRPGTYYWRVQRINCDITNCREYGPIWGFNLVSPPPPPPPSGGGNTGPKLRLTGYVGCGLSRNARAMSRCNRTHVGAFFKSSQAVRYSVCVKFPNGRNLCARNQEAEAGVLYVNKITAGAKGLYWVTWNANGRRVVRSFTRT